MHDLHHLRLIGVRHGASTDGSHLLALSEDETDLILTALVREEPQAGAVILSTCSRTELYWTGVGRSSMVDRFHRLVGELHPGAPRVDGVDHRVEADGLAAARHMFRVVSGLDSPVLGDTQIVGQFRRSLDRAHRAGTLDPILRHLGQRAVALGRRVRRETSIGDGEAGIGSSIRSVVERRLGAGRGSLAASNVVVIGAGSAGRVAAHQLRRLGAGSMTILNRDGARAAALADEVGGRALPLDRLADAVLGADIVIAAIAGTGIVLTRGLLAEAHDRRGRLLVVDLSFPSVTEATPGVTVELLDSIAAPTPPARLLAIPDVERRCAAEVEQVRHWQESAPLEDAIRTLYADVGAALRHLPVDGGADVRRRIRAALHHHVTALRTDAYAPTIPSPPDSPAINRRDSLTSLIGVPRERIGC